MKKTSIAILSLIMAFALLLSACGGKGETTSGEQDGTGQEPHEVKTLKIGSVNSDKHTLYQGYVKFKEIVEEKTNGAIQVEIYPNGQLGDDRSMIEGLQLGTLEAVGVSTSMLGNWAPPMLVYDLPFVFPNEEVADRVLDGPFGQKIAGLLEKEGLVLLSYMENGFRNLTNNIREVKTAEDVKGMKIRVMQTPLHLAIWKALGANPTPMAYTELFTALQQGVVDGQENPYGNIALDKFYEVQKYMTITNHVYNPMGFVFSKKFLDSLTPEQQQILKDAAVEAAKHQRQLNREKNEEFKKIIADGGTKITELTPEQRQTFVDKVQSVYEQYRSQIGSEYLDEFLKEVQAQ